MPKLVRKHITSAFKATQHEKAITYGTKEADIDKVEKKRGTLDQEHLAAPGCAFLIPRFMVKDDTLTNDDENDIYLMFFDKQRRTQFMFQDATDQLLSNYEKTIETSKSTKSIDEVLSDNMVANSRILGVELAKVEYRLGNTPLIGAETIGDIGDGSTKSFTGFIPIKKPDGTTRIYNFKIASNDKGRYEELLNRFTHKFVFTSSEADSALKYRASARPKYICRVTVV